MNALLKNIFTASYARSTNKEIILWWESRRIFYNLIMLIAGSFTVLLALILNEIVFIDLVNVIPPILIFALCANLFYTLGWIIEIVCCKLIPEKKLLQNAGTILFIGGIIISVLFTFAIDIALLVSFFFGN
jgi:hypothetical protein